MKTKLSILLSTACVVGLLGVSLAPAAQAAGEEKPAAATPAKDYVILKVGDDKIQYSEVETIWKSLFPEGQAPEFSRFDDKVRQNVLRGIVSEHAIYGKAKTSGLKDSPKIKEMLARLERKFITQEFLEQQVAAKVSDADVRKEYDRHASEMKNKKEVRARHILVKTEDEAKALKAQLKDGKKFEDLAKEKSLDAASAKRGGDLGYFGDQVMTEAFSKAAFAMKKGDISDPVKTEFGWHIIKREDERPATLLPFEQEEAGIREELKAAALNKYVQDVLDSTEVQYFAPDGKTLELTKTPDQTEKQGQ